MQNMGQPGPRRETPTLRIEAAAPEPEKPAFESEVPMPKLEIPTLAESGKKQFPPGCVKSRPKLTAEEILEKLRKPKYQV